ncbi:MAG: methionyl-tRNA formyltransferase [Actinomycetaceae bacterium]|nr:methionyl-tRNA formyltransferase [Actinomycetaceae bacterium]MDU0969495.1 methionyl-tRNA formyltransferase [Actinomycetaceae bacterium]
MKCVFAGTPDTAVPVLQALIDSPHEVTAVLTRPPARKGRRRQLVPSPVHQAAEAAGIDVLTPRTLKDPEVQAQVRALDADVVVVVAYGLIIPKELLHAFPHGWINLHFSLLPRWRGAAPVQRAIMEGDTVTGVSVFQIEEGLDTGPVYAQYPYPILPEVTTPQLMASLARHGAEVTLAVVDGFAAGTATPREQEDRGVTYASMVHSSDAHVNFADPAEVIERQVRALADNPGCWAMLGEKRMKIGRVVLENTANLAPGRLSVGKNEVRVGTGTKDLLIASIAAPGKRLMPAGDWARGAHLGPDSAFELGDAE